MLQVTNWEENDEMNYDEADFQKFIILKRSGEHLELDRFDVIYT